MTALRNLRILMIAPEAWSHNFLSKHHYAQGLARRNNTVYYLNPPAEKDQVTQVEPGIFVVDYKARMRGINHLPKFMSIWFQQAEVTRLKEILGGGIDLVWSFDPYRFQALRLFGARYVWYYAADWHHNKSLDNWTADSADVLMSPARIILDGISTRTQKIKMNHGIADYFLQPADPKKLPGSRPVKALYVGNLASKLLDSRLMIRVVQSNTHVDFIFIGEPEGEIHEQLRERDHVHFAGRIPNNLVPGYLAGADVLWLCYDTVRYRREASNSHKVLEYLASGRAVVSTYIDEYADKTDLLLMPDNHEDLPAYFGRVVQHISTHNNESNSRRRREFASANSYSGHLDQLERLLTKAG